MSNDGWFQRQANLAIQSKNARPSWIKDSYQNTSTASGKRKDSTVKNSSSTESKQSFSSKK